MAEEPEFAPDQPGLMKTSGPLIEQIVTAEIERDGRYLITQRPERGVLPGLWEFPGGKCQSGCEHE